jgi:integrase/recombinase XerD
MGTGAVAVTRQDILATADKWVSRRSYRGRRPHGRAARKMFVSIATGWSRYLEIYVDEPLDPACEAQLQAFARHMVEERALSPITIRMRLCRTTELLRFITLQGISLGKLKLEYIDDLMALKSSRDKLSRASMQNYANHLRSFVRFAETQGWCQPGLAAGIQPGRVYKGETLPAGPSWDTVAKMIAETSGGQPQQIRDHAIILLLALYGFRVSEVRRLRLSDVDWSNMVIRLRRTKPHEHVVSYPLTHTAANALAHYLQSVRPRSMHPEVFLRMQPPHPPLGNGALWHVVSRRLRPLGQHLKHHGPHTLRHACATRLLECGMGMKEIGDFLGHQHPGSTAVYAAVNLASLRRVADIDLGRFI